MRELLGCSPLVRSLPAPIASGTASRRVPLMVALTHSAVALLRSLPVADDYLFILVLIGDSGVGKSCLLLRFAVSIM